MTTLLNSGIAQKVYVINEDILAIGMAALSSSSNSATTLISGTSGKINDIVSLVVTNESSTATIVTLSDGSNSYKFAIAANGGMVWSPQLPVPAQTSGATWTVLNSAGVAMDYVAEYIQEPEIT